MARSNLPVVLLELRKSVIKLLNMRKIDHWDVRILPLTVHGGKYRPQRENFFHANGNLILCRLESATMYLVFQPFSFLPFVRCWLLVENGNGVYLRLDYRN